MKQKKWIHYLIITILLGTSAYFLGTAIGYKWVKGKEKKQETINLTNVDTLENLDMETFLEQYNAKVTNNYQIESSEISKQTIKKDDITFQFVLKNNSISIVAITYPKQTDTINTIIKAIIQANNQNITDEDVNLLIDKTKETYNEKTNSSEYFQFQGIETSLKKKDDNYQFRIGRITKD